MIGSTNSLLIGLFLAVSLCSGSAGAQRVDQRFPESANVPEGSDDGALARKVMDKFSGCIFKSKRLRVLQALTHPEAKESFKRLGRLITAECLYDGELRFDRRLLRGALFTHAYRAQFLEAPADLSSVLPIIYATSGDQIYDASMPYSDCVVRTDAANTHILIYSEIASGQEQAAFKSLAPTLGKCLSQGSQIKFSKTALRGFIAESLFRLANSPSTTAGGTR